MYMGVEIVPVSISNDEILNLCHYQGLSALLIFKYLTRCRNNTQKLI